MAPTAPIPGNSPGRTFTVAIWTVACLIGAQVLLVGWSILQRPAPETPAASIDSPGTAPLRSATRTSPDEGVLSRYIPPAPSTSDSTGNPGSPPVFVLPPSRLIDDPQALATIDRGVRLRAEGDMQGALAALREADAMLPDHPTVLHEMALTYRRMGLPERAEPMIERILSMGDSGAGDYFALWDMWKRESDLRDPRQPVRRQARLMQLGPIEALRDPAVTRGEKIILRIPIQANPDAAIDPVGVEVYVYFYDLVDGQRVEQTTADEPTYLFVTSPVDWEDDESSETLEVVYYHPQLSPEEIRELGRRRFHGYVVKLFYQNQLQDEVADPTSLTDRVTDRPAVEQGPVSPLFPDAP